ncbi:MAG: dynamin family protein [Candidatus Muiribacteriota bacterium]
MLKTQSEFLDYIKDVNKEIESSSISGKIKEKLINKFMEKAIKEAELLIPVVGAFSSGKSSLINSFLGKEYLPVDITPETSLATEIRYSSEDIIHAVKGNSEIEEYPFANIQEVVNKAKNYKYLKVYLNNENIKKIEPLILVDMPGFDSPLDLHNQAIMEYIDKGSHYIVLTSVEDGSITRSMTRQLSDIQEYGRDFTFFLSKTNLRAESDIDEVIEKIEEQIEDTFDTSKKVLKLGLNSGESLNEILDGIDPEELFKDIFLIPLKENYSNIVENLNTNIAVLKKNKSENLDAVKELKKGLENLEKKRNSMIDQAKQKYSDTNVASIVSAVGKDLSDSSDELAQAALKGGETALSQSITEIVRHSLIENVKYSMSSIGENIVNDFSLSLNSLNYTISSFSINEDWLSKITESTKMMMERTQTFLDNSSDTLLNKEKSGTIYKAISTILAVTTQIINPVLELIIIFLPDIILGFFKSSQEKKQLQEIKSSILTEVIPSFKRQLSMKLPQIFEEQVDELIQNIAKEFENELSEKQSAIESMEKEKETRIDDINSEIKIYEDLSLKVTELTNKVLF